MITSKDSRLVHPVFTLYETAVYLAVPKSTIQDWARRAGDKPPLITVLPRRGAIATVPFIGFVEAFVLSAFRRAGLPLQRIRPAVDELSKTIGLEHALASKRLCTDGPEMLLEYAAQRHDEDLPDLVVARTGQHRFAEVVGDYVKRITYDTGGWAARVRLPCYQRAKVVVDPRVAFGLPLLVHGGARVKDLVDRFVAGDSVADVAYDFGVAPDEVEDVIRVATRAAA